MRPTRPRRPKGRLAQRYRLNIKPSPSKVRELPRLEPMKETA
jgi:hypothetical protein